MLRLILSVLIALAAPATAYAWGDDGHRLVCQIAYERLTPSTRAKVDTIIAGNPRGAKTFAQACTYPDKWRSANKANPIKARSAEHFINMPRDVLEISGATCGVASQRAGCALSAIDLDFDRLKDPDASAYRKWRALAFLGHFVGDIHQPLHISYEDDNGGNGLHIAGDCTELAIDNLHSVWDTCVLRKHIYRRQVRVDQFFEDPLFHQVAADLAAVPSAEASAWLAVPRFEWARESYQITTDPAAHYCQVGNGRCSKAGTSERLANGKRQRTVELETHDASAGTPSYSERFAPVVRQRLQQAGVRLAALIEAAL